MGSGVFLGISASETGRYTDVWAQLFRMGNPGVPLEVRVAHGGNIARNRNQLAEWFLESDKSHLFYLDDDQILLPGTIPKLLAHDVDVVSGVTPQRDFPFPASVYEELVDGSVRLRDLGESSGLIRVAAVGAGCLLVHRRVFEALEPPYWRLGQVKADGLGEDLDFCRRVRAAGFVIHCDLETPVGHKSHCSLWPRKTETGWGTMVVTSDRPVAQVTP